MQVAPVSSYARISRRHAAAPHYSRTDRSARSSPEPERARRTDAPRSADQGRSNEPRRTEDRPARRLDSATTELSLTVSNDLALQATLVQLNSFDFGV